MRNQQTPMVTESLYTGNFLEMWRQDTHWPLWQGDSEIGLCQPY